MAHNPGKEEFESRFTPQTRKIGSEEWNSHAGYETEEMAQETANKMTAPGDIYENRVVASDNPDSEKANYQDDHSSIINKMWGPKETEGENA